MGSESRPASRAFVALGANLGPAREHVREALARIAQLPGTTVEGVSPFYCTRPVDAEGPDFINAVAALRTSLEGEELLQALLSIEALMGRERPWRNAPRVIDLDLLSLAGRVHHSATLTLPHPRMFQRAFVLEPLAALLAGLPPEATDPALPSEAERLRLAREQGIRLDFVGKPG